MGSLPETKTGISSFKIRNSRAVAGTGGGFFTATGSGCVINPTHPFHGIKEHEQ